MVEGAYYIIVDIKFDIRFDTMRALSLHLPEKLATESQAVAEELGISRTQFIRQAVIHELQTYQVQIERERLAKTFSKMHSDVRYRKQLSDLDQEFTTSLPEDKDNWWKKKK